MAATFKLKSSYPLKTMKKSYTGRRSRLESQLTKEKIIEHAEDLFRKKSYSQVTLRDIAEHSGVSHGLIRYHFGNKEKLWKKVHNCLLSQQNNFEEYIVENLSKQYSLAANTRLYMVTIKILAFFMINSPPVNLEIDFVPEKHKSGERFLSNEIIDDSMLKSLLDEFNKKHSKRKISIVEYKWLMISAINSASRLSDVYSKLSSQEGSEHGENLFNQWKIQNKLFSNIFGIDEQDMVTPTRLEDLILI